MYSVSDDKVLCNAWLSTPDDAQDGRYHHASFWGRICQVFNANSEVVRNEASLRHRWQCIVAEINKFAGCYAQMGCISFLCLIMMLYSISFIALTSYSIW